MRKILKQVIAYFLIRLHYLTKGNDEDILSLFFHNPPKELFEKIIIWLTARDYQFISLKELEEIISRKEKTRKKVFITFDDGWNKNLELINVIEKYKVPIAIFIPTEAVGSGNYWFEYAQVKGQEKVSHISNIADFKNLPNNVRLEKLKLLKQNYTLPRSCVTLDELKKISHHELITIGSHTVSHPLLDKCSANQQSHELTDSKKTLHEWLGQDIDYLAYPNGNYNDDTLAISAKAGYKLAFTVVPAKVNVETVNPYLVPRYCIDDEGGYFDSIAKVLGVWQKYRHRRKEMIS